MSLGKIKLKNFDRNKALAAKQSSRLLDYQSAPEGYGFMPAEDHPLYDFFQASFSCSEYVYLRNPWAMICPKNLYSTDSLNIRKDFIEALKSNISTHEWSKVSRHIKEDLAFCFASYVHRVNEERKENKYDSGVNLSRGSLGDFLRQNYWKMLVEEEKMTESDIEFIKKYFMVITSDQLSLPKAEPKAKSILPIHQSKLLVNDNYLPTNIHPLKDFFGKTFSFESALRLISPWDKPGKPNNFCTTYSSNYTHEDFQKVLAAHEILGTLSSFSKKILADCYSSHITQSNAERITEDDHGLNISRGDLNLYLKAAQQRLLNEELKIPQSDLEILKVYFIVDKLDLSKVA